MLTNYELLFGAVFLSQIGLVSIYQPWRLRRMSERLEVGHHSINTVAALPRNYWLLNAAISLIGLCLLGGLLQSGLASHMTATLLSIGAYFFLQLSTLANSRIRRLSAALRSTPVKNTQRANLYAFVGQTPVALAAMLVAAYLIFAASRWTGSLNTHLLKMTIFAGTQLLFGSLIGWNLLKLHRESGEIAAQRYQALSRLVPLLTFASLMVSVYYFGKEIIAVLDLNPMRPVMMSAFLQLNACLVIGTLFPARRSPAMLSIRTGSRHTSTPS